MHFFVACCVGTLFYDDVRALFLAEIPRTQAKWATSTLSSLMIGPGRAWGILVSQTGRAERAMGKFMSATVTD